jgi:hypothetical protein
MEERNKGGKEKRQEGGKGGKKERNKGGKTRRRKAGKEERIRKEQRTGITNYMLHTTESTLPCVRFGLARWSQERR